MTAFLFKLGLSLVCLAAAGPDGQTGNLELAVGSQGLLFETHGPKTTMSGPALPGEVNFLGDFVPGLLGPREGRQFRSRHPDAYKVPQDDVGARRLVIVLDPGHGGKQTGAIGTRGTIEKNLALDVARLTRKCLEQVPGIVVVMTRQGDHDVPLWDRVDMANEVGADLFISVHANAFPKPSLDGVETFFHSIEASGVEARRVAEYENEPAAGETGKTQDTLNFILHDIQSAERLRDSSRLAYLVQAELAHALPIVNRGVMQADFVVLRGTRMASVLIELGFLTNPKDEKVLRSASATERAAEAIKRGVLAFRKLMLKKAERQAPEARAR